MNRGLPSPAYEHNTPMAQQYRDRKREQYLQEHAERASKRVEFLKANAQKQEADPPPIRIVREPVWLGSSLDKVETVEA